MADDNKRKLYNALSEEYDMGTYEQFCNDLNDETKRRKLYDSTSEEYDYGSWDDFSSQLGYRQQAPQPEVPEAPIPTTTEAQNPGEAPTQTEAQSVQTQQQTRPQGPTAPIAGNVNKSWFAPKQHIKVKTPNGDYYAPTTGISEAGSLEAYMKNNGIHDYTVYLAKPGQPVIDVSPDEMGDYTSQGYNWYGSEQEVSGYSNDIAAVKAIMSGEGFDPEKLQQVKNSITGLGLDPNNIEHVMWVVSGNDTKILQYRLDDAEKRYRDLTARRNAEMERRRQASSDSHADNPNDPWYKRFENFLMRVAHEAGDPTPTMAQAYRRSPVSGVPQNSSDYYDYDSDIKDVLSEILMLEHAKRVSQSAKKLKKSEGFAGGFFNVSNNWTNFWTGVQDTLADPDFWGMGTISLHHSERLSNLKEKLDRGAGLSDGDFALAYSSIVSNQAVANADLPHGYNAGAITTEMAPFMIQMAANPASGFTRMLTEKFGKSAAKKILLTIAGDVTEATVLANTLQAPATIADIEQRHLGQVTWDEDTFRFEGGDPWATAIAKGQGAAVIENYTELLGGHFGKIKGAAVKYGDKALRKIGAGSVLDQIGYLTTKVKSTSWAKAISNIEARAQWNGTIEEMLEEEAGIILNSIFVGDNRLSDLVDADQQIDIALGVGVFGGFVSGVKTVGYPVGKARANRALNKATSRGASLFPEDEWAAICEAISQTDDTELSSAVVGACRVFSNSQEQDKAILDYANALSRARGYNLAELAQTEENANDTDGTLGADLNAITTSINDSYNSGYDAQTPREKNDARNMINYQRSRVENEFEADFISQLDNDPVITLSDMTIENGFTQEQIDMAKDYVQAKAVHDGIMQRFEDDVEDDIADSNALIDSHINSSNGMLQPAVIGLDKKQVYIIDGDIVLNDNGTINLDASSESIVIVDPATGKREFADPKDIVSLGQQSDPAIEKANTSANIRQQAEEALNNALNGTLALNPGDVVTIHSNTGVSDVTIIGGAVDENGLPLANMVTVQFEDGSQRVINTDALQQMADIANQDRLNDIIAQREALREQQRQQEAQAEEAPEEELQEAELPELRLNDEFTILDESGFPVRGSITAEIDEDGTIEIYTEEPLNGKKVNRLTPEEFFDLVDTYNGQSLEAEFQPDFNYEDVIEPEAAGEGGEIEDNNGLDNPNRDRTLLTDTWTMPYYDFETRATRYIESENGTGGMLYQDENGNDAIVVSAVDDNNYVGYFREYDEEGNPTNRWSAKMLTESGNTSTFRDMIETAQKLLPEGHELTEHTSASTDGLRTFANQLKHGYELQRDEEGNIITNEVGVNMMARNNALEITDYDAGSEAEISGNYTEEEKAAITERLKPFMEALGLDESNIHWRDGKLTVDLPVLRKSPVVATETEEGIPPLTEEQLDQMARPESEGGILIDTTPREEEQQPSSLSQVPLDEAGNPMYDEVEPDLAWDAIVEQSEGDEEIAAEVIADEIADREKVLSDAERALKKIVEGKPEKRKAGDPAPTMAERIAAKTEAKKALADAQATRDEAQKAVDHWKNIASTLQRRQEAQQRAEREEARRQAEARAAEEARLKAEREEQERQEREALNGVPDWGRDTPADARARGFRRNGPEKVDRPSPIENAAMGKEIEVKFGEDKIQKGHVAVIDASQLQPSHRDGARNPRHFLDEAQPKERTDVASQLAADKIAKNIRPEEITSSVTAFTGAPSVNTRGEGIQGNNRSEGLLKMYEGQPESEAKYKQYLIDHASDFGLTPEQIQAIEKPVLVNLFDVTDEEAIKLGQYTQQDLESGGIERIKPKNAVERMGEKIKNFANILLRSTDDEATFAQLVDSNGVDVLKWMNRNGFITDTQYQSAFDSKGNLTAEASNDLKGIMYQSIFAGGSTRLEEMFNRMPAKAQRALLATAFRDYDSAHGDRMMDEIQQSIIAFDALMAYEPFREATNPDGAQRAVEAWKRQYAFDDVSGESYLPSETFSNFALALAAMYKGCTQKHIQATFNTLYDIIQGKQEATLFDEADNTPKSLTEAIKEVLGMEYQPVKAIETNNNNQNQNNNGTEGSTLLDSNTEGSEAGEPGSISDTSESEPNEEGEGPADSGTGTNSNSGEDLDLAFGDEEMGETDNQGEETLGTEGEEDYTALEQRIEITDDDWTEGEGPTPIQKRTIIVDGKHNVIQVDEPDERGFYKGSYFEFNGQRFGDLREVINHIDNNANLAANISEAEKDVEQNPTEKQKLAGNYKKGHVKVGKFDVSIENPAGSVREGRDADGKEWRTTMQNTYGYIRGTKGVDGDHIDVYLSGDIEGWNGNTVVIIDQYNPDGTFDEHKVMLGFNSMDEAKEAYLSNYEEGWENGRRLVFTTADLADFEKWIESSHRKTKAYHEYKIAENGETQENHSDPITEEANDTLTPEQKEEKLVEEFAELLSQHRDFINTENGNSIPDVKEQVERSLLYDLIVNESDRLIKEAPEFLDKIADKAPMNPLRDKIISQAIKKHRKNQKSQEDTKEEELLSIEQIEALPWNKMSVFHTDSGFSYKDAAISYVKGSRSPENKMAYDHAVRVFNEENSKQDTTDAGYEIDTYTTKGKKEYVRVIFPRADKEVWKERLAIAKKMGGFSVPKGYGFKTREEAEAFAQSVLNTETSSNDAPLSLSDMQNVSGGMSRVNVESLFNQLQEEGEANLADHSTPVDTSTEEKPIAETKEEGNDDISAIVDILKTPKGQKPKKPSNNKLVTDSRYEELKNRMKEKLGGQMNMGIDPEILAIGAEMAVYHIEKGARKFNAYAKAMIEDLGDTIRPYLKSFYNAVRDMPEVEAAGLLSEMDSYDDVRGVDIANFDKITTDAMATAEAVAREQEVEKEKKEATDKIKGQREEKPVEGGLWDLMQEEETPTSSLVIPEERPEELLAGNSAEFQTKEKQTAELVAEIGGVIENRALMAKLDMTRVKPLTMAEVKKIASKYTELSDISDTDLQELVELAMTQLTRNIAMSGVKLADIAQKEAFDQIVSLYQMQPSLNARDSERLMKQQYSTPTPFGFVMGQFVQANGKQVKSVLEPSAGNGALTITFAPNLVHVNDIDEARLANLRKLGYKEVTAQDALLPFGGDQVDAVMTNPPFGTVTEKVYDGVFKISSLEGQMAINALDNMADDGRAAIVIGGNTSYRSNGSMNPKDAALFGYLYSHYNVADVINISGKALYSRNGTGYDVRMILINGRKTGEFKREFPPVQSKARSEQVTTFEELYNRVQDDIQQIQQMGSESANEQSATRPATNGTESTPVREGSNNPHEGAGQRPNKTSDGVKPAPRTNSGQSKSGNEGGRTSRVDNADGRNDGSVNHVQGPKSGETGSVRSGSTKNDGGRSGGDGHKPTTSQPNRSGERLEVKPDLTTEKVAYPNQSDNGFTLMSVVPAAQAPALQKSLGEIGDVDQYLVDQLGYSSKEELYGYLAAEQIDSVALAINQMENGNAFIIGDMTGVGKGRQGAALIRYGVNNGYTPIYFTQKPTLFTDNYRDLADIGSDDLKPFIIASNPKDANIVDVNGNIVHKLPSKKEQERVFQYISQNGKLPPEYDYILTTYDQIKNGTKDYEPNEDGTWKTVDRKLPKKSKGYTTADTNGQARRDALEILARESMTLSILDESHTVGGDSGMGRYMQMLTSKVDGLTFLSATFAKRADNMPIYAQRTAISEAGVKAQDLIDAINKGGVTLQEIMSKQLVESGQMIRRERSFEGVTIDWLNVSEEADVKQRKQFNEVANIFNGIRNFQDEYITPKIKEISEQLADQGGFAGHTQGTKDMGVQNVPFASKMYNLVNQLLFALKVDAVADRVVENLRNGFKPVISFTNTMEGFLAEAPKGVEMDEVPNFSLTLMRALDGVMRYTEKDASDNSEAGVIKVGDLDQSGQDAYNAIRKQIMELSADLPISPMDAIRMKIEEAGYSVAEITGRTMQLNKTANGKYVVETRKDRDKKAAMRDFNSGKLDVLMINKSGSTGISLHASSKFEDQRQRVMVFAQFQSDINDEVQMRGRIDRSGQVCRGRYEYIMSTIPAEQRIQMMFKAKLKSLDANTTSSQKSKFNEMEIVDYLNKYGDEVVLAYMKEHPELSERLGDPLKLLQADKFNEERKDEGREVEVKSIEGCAGKISRYLAFLSVEEQDEIFKEITEAYKVKIQLLDDAGDNDLEITTMPLRAETLSRKIWKEGTAPESGNAFADNTYVEEVEVDVLKKPMKKAEIEDQIRKLLGEETHSTEKQKEKIEQFYQQKVEDALAKMAVSAEKKAQKAYTKAIDAATKARGEGKNDFSDADIKGLAEVAAEGIRAEEQKRMDARRIEIMNVKDKIFKRMQYLHPGTTYVVPQDLKEASGSLFVQNFGIFLGFKFNKTYTLGSSTALFATLDGRRKVELSLNDKGLDIILSSTRTAHQFSPNDIKKHSLENWDSNVPNTTRQKRYIITGNLLQALVDTEKGERTRGNLISYSTIDGETRQGILMGQNFKPSDLRSSAPLSSRLAQIKAGDTVVSEDGEVQISKGYGWQRQGDYELKVPKSKQRGGVYTTNPELLKLVEYGNFVSKGNYMVAGIRENNLARVVDMLSRDPFYVTVLEQSKLTDSDTADDVLYRTSEEIDAQYPNWLDGTTTESGKHSTQVEGTRKTYNKVGDWIEQNLGKDVAILDASSGMGYGTADLCERGFNIEDVEPYQSEQRKAENPATYDSYEKINKQYDVIISNAVLNVIPDDWRRNVLHDMASRLNPGGMLFINTRKAGEEKNIKDKIELDSPQEVLVKRNGKIASYQRFFTPKELKEWVESELGDGYTVEIANEKNSGTKGLAAVVVTKTNDVTNDRPGRGAYTDNEVSVYNDLISRIEGKSRFSKKRQAEWAAKERQRMAKRISELAEKLHIDNIDILTDGSGLEGKRASAKGFFNRRTGKITIVIPNHLSMIDAEQTLLHEAVAHYGLRKLFGEHFEDFLDNVYEAADPEIRRKITEMAAQNGWDFRTATEEYLAGLAETIDVSDYEEGVPVWKRNEWWSKIKRMFVNMLDKIGFKGFKDSAGMTLSDNELKYLLWISYQNIRRPGEIKSLIGEAEDVSKQHEWKVGNYAEIGIEADYAAEPGETENLNERFNEELEKYENGELKQRHRFDLGMPSKYLRSAGFPNLPISMRSGLLERKSRDDSHPFEAKDLKGLVEAIQKPIAIFRYTKSNMRNLIVDLTHGGKHFLVGVTLNYKDGKIEINSVSGLFPKDNIEWLKWMQDEVKDRQTGEKVSKVIRIDQKEKALAILDRIRTTNTVAFAKIGMDPDLVANIIKDFENPAMEEEELFRPGDFSPRDKVYARDTYERMVGKGGYQFKEAVQDSMLGLKTLYQAILGKKTRIEDVAGFENAYLYENRMSSMNAGEQHEYFVRFMKPLLEEIGRICGANKRKRRELTDYIMAKHGLERNEYMRNEAATNGERTDRDFAGLIGLTGEADWQAAEDVAKQWVDDYENMYDTSDLWEAINNATKATLEKVYTAGIISKETFDKVSTMYQYYVPLRGWNETTSDEVYGYLTSPNGPLNGSIVKRAEGRESMADDPIATIGMMADDAIRQGNRNLMKQRFLNFVMNHPSDAVSVHDIWLEHDDVTDEWNPVFADIEETDTPEQIAQKIEDFENLMETLKAAEPDKYKRGREAQNIPYKVVRGNLNEHQILIKRNGRTFVATINGNPRAAQAVNGLTNPDVDTNGVVGNMLRAGQWVNRQLSAFYTTRNPDFVVSNFFRDMLYSNCMTWVKESPKYALNFHKNFGKLNPVILRRLLGKWESGKLNRSNRMERMFYDFMKNGGETGYTNVRDIEGHKRAVAAELKKQGSVGRRAWTALGMQLDLLNRSAENCARFAAFVTSREMGRSIDRAIYDAKEISVNFNKKGSGGKMVNATGQTRLGKTGAYLGGGGRILYVFWNAGVQGMTNFARQAKLHPAKFVVGASSLFALGYVIPMLAQMMGGGDGDDDDKNAYYNLPEYVRRSNICFKAGEQWITIPLPIEYRAMYGMGELGYGVMSGNERYNNSELAFQMTSQVSQILPIDMLEGGGGISPFIPSAAKPFTEAYIMNKGWTGLPVYNDSPFNKNMPEWTKAYASADQHLVGFAKWLNEVSGGDDFKKGKIDINPAKIEYLLNGTFGGMFTFPNKIKKSMETAFGDREFEWRNMPIANRIVKSGDERTANRKLQNEYFKYKEEYDETGRLMRKYENAEENGDEAYTAKIEQLVNSPEYARWQVFDDYKPDIEALKEDIAAETDADMKKQLEAEYYSLMREMIEYLHNPDKYLEQFEEE